MSGGIVTSSYSMLYYLISRQILYVLSLQLGEVDGSTYKISKHQYNITDTSLSFSFWTPQQHSGILPSPSNSCTLSLGKGENGLPTLLGECNGRSFAVDLRSYRIQSIVMEVCYY